MHANPDAGDLLDRLTASPADPRPVPRAAVIVAHPDDETVGAGARLPRLREALFVHVTDGAPRDLRDARAAGFETREAYAAARESELANALAGAGIAPERSHRLGLVDQEASLALAPLTRSVRDLLRAFRPEIVLTHPYEGGHPDHDATAFAVHGACRLLAHEGAPVPAVAEATSYHDRDGTMVVYEFLPDGGRAGAARVLSDDERALKRALIACYETQAAMLRYFPVEVERFRLAPAYDFTRPPHEGVLFYERFEWGMTGRRWRELAREALAELALQPLAPEVKQE